jgi:hypothetical protein
LEKDEFNVKVGTMVKNAIHQDILETSSLRQYHWIRDRPFGASGFADIHALKGAKRRHQS